MKALVLTETNRLELQDVPEPELGPEDVLIEVRAVGICGSDVHGMDGSTGRRQPPIVMGHEAAGVIARVGEAVDDWAPGDRVTFDSTIYCGRCAFCRDGQINLCDNRRVLGVSCDDYRRHGAFAQFVAVPRHIVYRLPEGLSFERAAMVEPLSIAFHAVNITPITLGDTAVVVGTGMIGLLAVEALRAAGCGRIFAVDLDQNKLDLA
ncbi:MAG: alcohol dehydrogenase catalytic domain-containing protein, partial [Planctomycetes bacterium]|nr:alcohol dehydrogenase catalytic domain-containing protein [Planctomycetota bacterium]